MQPISFYFMYPSNSCIIKAKIKKWSLSSEVGVQIVFMPFKNSKGTDQPANLYSQHLCNCMLRYYNLYDSCSTHKTKHLLTVEQVSRVFDENCRIIFVNSL